MQRYKSAKVSKVWTFIGLLFVTISVASGTFTGTRHHFRGQSGYRHPRQSGFRRASMKTDGQDRCEPITVPVCKDIGYNKTDMSLSIMDKSSQSEAAGELALFDPLLRVNCSSELKLFLCSIYTPICMEGYPKFLPPCRFVCERVRSGCLPIMNKYDSKWPKGLRCERFPEYAVGRAMCMHFNLTRPKKQSENSKATRRPTPITKLTKPTTRSTTETTTTTTPGTTTTKHITQPTIQKREQSDCIKDISHGEEIPRGSNGPTSKNCTQPSCLCRAPMVVIVDTTDALYNRVTTGGVPNCAVSCKSPYFTDDEISIAEVWIKSWSIVCFVVTLMTVSTFLIDMERFKYPERPIIFLSTCYMFVSIGFLIRIIAGHEAVACAYRTDHVLYHTTGPLLCTTVFLLVYFFSMASALWWVILSLTWFLASGLKWGSEAIEKYSQYYHAVAWLIPSLQTIMVLAMSSVDGDSLSGICFVGNQDVRALRGFVLAPLVVYLALGGMFLLAGFISLFRIRRRIKKEGTKTKKLEKLMGRIGVFSVLYMVPAATLVACYFYEQQYRPFWEYSHNCLPPDRTASYPMIAPVKPEFLVPMVRYLMTLLIGVTNGVWICSSKTLDSWSRFYTNRGSCHKSADKDVEESVSCQDEHKPGKKPGRNSMGHSEQDTDNRSDSYQARYLDKSIRYGASSKTESGNSRRTRFSASNEQSSRTPSRGRCETCERTSRCSGQNTSGADSHRKRRHSRAGGCTSSRLESSRRRHTGSEPRSKNCDLLCENNTTSTDGSDRPLGENGQTGCVSEDIGLSDPSKISFQEDQPGPTRNGHVVTDHSGLQNAQCHFCEDSCQKCFTLGGHYPINSNDNLPPCPTRPYQSLMPHDHGKSASTLPTSDCDHEVQTSLLNADSSYEYDHHGPNSPYYHYHHHHYHDGMR